MTLSELISVVDQLRPSHYDKDQVTGWVNEVESKAVREVINMAEGGEDIFVPYLYDEHSENVLRIPDDHQDVYITYILAKMDFFNAEYDRYNADASLYEAAWQDYAADYRRRNRPKSYEITHCKVIHKQT